MFKITVAKLQSPMRTIPFTRLLDICWPYVHASSLYNATLLACDTKMSYSFINPVMTTYTQQKRKFTVLIFEYGFQCCHTHIASPPSNLLLLEVPYWINNKCYMEMRALQSASLDLTCIAATRQHYSVLLVQYRRSGKFPC